jgi:NADPH2:quinone reductase
VDVRAIVHDPAAGLRHTDVPDPDPRPSELLLDVRAAALNFLDVAYHDELFAPGAVLGVDAAGVVLAPAADGSGPPAGSRVVTFALGGAWAQRRAAATADAAVVPDGVDLAVAAALPAAGVTALHAVRRLGPLLGRRVLVTGASGGVGRYAVQLAARAGADVVAAVGNPGRACGLVELGARQVVTDLADVTMPVHGVLDNVGGPLLAEAFALLAEDGLALSIGQASRQPTTIDFEQERRRGGGRRLEPFTVPSGIGPDLAVLLDLVERGQLDSQIGWRGSWLRAADAAEALLARQVPGKAVLEIG